MNDSRPFPAVTYEFAPWLEALRLRGRSPRTIRAYELAIRNFSRFIQTRGVSQLNEVRRHDLERWRCHLRDASCAPATIDLFLRALRGAFEWFTRSGRLFLNPAERLVSPQIPRVPKFVPSEEKMAQFLDALPSRGPIGLRDRALLEMMYASGARLEEMVRLNVDSIDFGRRLLRLRGKGDKDRLVPLTSQAIEAINRYLMAARPILIRGEETERALFISQRGGRRLASYAIEGVVGRRGRAVGIDELTPHGIRRAFATHLSRAGASAEEIRSLLGHSSHRHLGHYLVFHPDEMAATVRRARPCRR